MSKRQAARPESARSSDTADAKRIAKGAGTPRFSHAADRLMTAEPVRRIDPRSPEGQAIAELALQR